MDENLTSKLELAYGFKRQAKLHESMEIYLEVLRSETLADSLIEKHVVMRLNCHRNLGEVFENLQGFEQAKHHYTQALKIEPNDPLSWTRLGFLNYEHFRDLKVAKGCFQAAAHTLPTLERAGPKICPILVKLAEISFLDVEFEECEKIVDAILYRQTQDKKTLLFSLLLKHYLLSLKSSDQAHVYLKKADEIQPGSKVSQLEVFQRAKARSNKLAIVYNQAAQGYQAIGGVDDRRIIQLQPIEIKEPSFLAFLNGLLQSVLVHGDLKQTLMPESTAIFDFSQFIAILENNSKTYQQNWVKQQAVEAPQQDEHMASAESPLHQQDKKIDKMKQNRKKLDSSEKQILAINLNRLNTYKDYINNLFGDEVVELSSIQEIMTFKDLIERGANSQQQLPQNIHAVRNDNFTDIRLLDEFRVILSSKMDRHGCAYVVRNLLRYLCRNNGLIGSQEASLLFKLFIARLDEQSLSICDPEVLIFMFELALFNKEVIKETKSGPIMNLRMQFYDFCDANFDELLNRLQLDAQKFRLTYTMMFTAFEVKNDMEASVKYFDKLNLNFLLSEGPISLHWISSSFQLDFESISVFGQQKIKEAQVINTQNQALKDIKQREFDSTKTSYVRQPCTPKMALFYAEQLFLQLSSLVKTQDTSHGVNFQSTEDKIKEIWDQLLFCLVRVQPTSEFFKITNHLMSVLTAFQFLARAPSASSSLYDKVLLKKIDFEPLMTEIGERLRCLLNEVILSQPNSQNYQNDGIVLLANNEITPKTLFKLLTHLLRLFTADFVYFNLKIGGSVSNPTDPGQPFLTAYFKSLFFLELFRSVLLADQMMGLYLLTQQLDSLAQEYQDFFMRAYTKLFISGFPFLIRLSLSGANNQHFNLLIQKSLKYLFSMVPSQNGEQPVDQAEDEDEDYTEFSLFACMNQRNADKPKYAIMKPHEVFRAIVLKQKEIDVGVMVDLVRYSNQMMNGHLLSHGQLTMQDIQNCSKLIETLSKLLQDKKGELSKYQAKSSEQSQFLKYTAFKDNPFVAETQLAQNFPSQLAGIHIIIQAIVNVFGTLAIQVYDPNANMTFSKRSQLLDRFPSLSDLKKMRTLISLDLQFTNDPAQSALMFSVVELQNYMQALDTKLLDDYKHADNYINIRQLKLQTVNSAVYSLHQNYLRGDWQNCLRSLHQLLKINYIRTLTKRDRSKPKFKNLLATCSFLAFSCESLEYLTQPQRKDPRAKLFPAQTLHETTKQIVQGVLQMLQVSVQENAGAVSSSGKTQLFQPQNVTSCIASMREILAPVQSYFATVSRQSLNPDYPFIQAQMIRLGNQTDYSIDVQLYKQALDLAAARNEVSVFFESLICLLDRSLQSAFHLKYALPANQNDTLAKQENFIQFTKAIQQSSDSYLQRFLDKLKPQEPADGNSLEFLVFDRSNVHMMRSKAIPVSNEMNQMDFFITKLYKMGDVAISCLSQVTTDVPAANWLINRFKYMLQNNMAQEIRVGAPQESLKFVLEDVVQGLKEMQTSEDQITAKFESLGQLPIFKQQLLSTYHNQFFNSVQKSLISTFFCSAVTNGLTEHRINYKLLLLRLCQAVIVYEPAFHLYKKQYEVYKKSIASAAEKLMEHPLLFREAKESLIHTLKLSVEQLAEHYLFLRREYMKYDEQKSRQGYSEAKIAYTQFRQKYELTNNNQPQVLRDTLELFVETHYSKQFLKKHNLVNDIQKGSIRQTLIYVCGICGPDHETEPGAIKMVDLLRLTENDYQWEALKTCLVWYQKFLDENKKGKKDLDLQKRLQATFEEIQQEILVATSDSKQRPGVYQTPSKQPRQELSASKVFVQKKLN